MSNTLVIPVSYVDGTDALAADVNSNFNAVSTFLNSTKLNDDNIKAGGISAVSLASAAVTGAKLDTTAADASTLEVAAGSMRAKDGGITTAKLADGAVTQAKRGTVPYAESASSSNTTTLALNSTFQAVGSLSASITATGSRPINVGLCPAFGGGGGVGTGAYSAIYGNNNATSVELAIQRDGSEIARIWMSGGGNLNPPSFLLTIDPSPAAGAHTYRLVAATPGSSITLTALNVKLVAWET